MRRLSLFRRKKASPPSEQAAATAPADAQLKDASSSKPDVSEQPAAAPSPESPGSSAAPIKPEAPDNPTPEAPPPVTMPANGPPPVAPLVVTQAFPPALEQRIHQLEDLVARLQDTKDLEERVTEHVTRRLKKTRSRNDSPDVLTDAARHILPAAAQMLQPPPPPGATPRGRWGIWLVWDFYVEVRTMLGMIFDSSYRASWGVRSVPLAVVLVIILSGILLSWLSLLGPFGWILDRVVDLVAAFIGYKILSKEAERYRHFRSQIQ